MYSKTLIKMKKIIVILFVLFLCVSFVSYNSLKNMFLNDSQTNEKVTVTKIDLSKKFKINGYVNMIKLTKNSVSYKVTNKSAGCYDISSGRHVALCQHVALSTDISSGSYVSASIYIASD